MFVIPKPLQMLNEWLLPEFALPFYDPKGDRSQQRKEQCMWSRWWLCHQWSEIDLVSFKLFSTNCFTKSATLSCISCKCFQLQGRPLPGCFIEFSFKCAVKKEIVWFRHTSVWKYKKIIHTLCTFYWYIYHDLLKHSNLFLMEAFEVLKALKKTRK